MQSVEAFVAAVTGEIQLGEQLLDNMSAQREAILAWNAAALLERLTEKELLLHKLQALTTRRRELLDHHSCSPAGRPDSLDDLLGRLPTGPEKVALNDLRLRVRAIYARVRTEEHKLVGLLDHLLGHMGEVFASLARVPVHIYGRNGTSSLPRPQSELIQGKV